MPFKANSSFDALKVENDLPRGVCVEDEVYNQRDASGFVTILDDNDVLLLVKDKPNSISDILFLQDEDDDSLLVQDNPQDVPVNPEFITEEDEAFLIDAGPVFQGPEGKVGPAGPSVFETWQAETGNSGGTFADFINYLRQGLGTGQSGGGTFIFTQYTPSTVWTIQHNLNKFPQIMCEDSAGESFDADYDYINENLIEITIISPIAGKAFLN